MTVESQGSKIYAPSPHGDFNTGLFAPPRLASGLDLMALLILPCYFRQLSITEKETNPVYGLQRRTLSYE